MVLHHIAFYQVWYLEFDLVVDPDRECYTKILQFACIQSTVFHRFIIVVFISTAYVCMYNIFFIRRHHIFYTG
jgi:hypothetical protein